MTSLTPCLHPNSSHPFFLQQILTFLLLAILGVPPPQNSHRSQSETSIAPSKNASGLIWRFRVPPTLQLLFLFLFETGQTQRPSDRLGFSTKPGSKFEGDRWKVEDFVWGGGRGSSLRVTKPRYTSGGASLIWNSLKGSNYSGTGSRYNSGWTSLILNSLRGSIYSGAGSR